MLFFGRTIPLLQGSSNLLGQSAAEFSSIKVTYLWFSNDLEDSDYHAQVGLT